MTKRNIQSFLNKMKENQDGTISGGFGAIRGGNMSVLDLGKNFTCENGTCSGTNETGCVNSGTCSGSTNNTSCTNLSSCFA
ncbi:hypothetical protein F0L74_20580 [Chitinophaga agrisoli]|uniref:Uncharacterized protein n=1 Tax=Chitinophaga agrisoli TaxID=2607653 RepID=A0A5B2VGD9_9BACT|nr:hypothetical protein [Chitinophaga agrisoli]KAA2238623.1 hypothetical protein F0L74_20580 [Chitinophaga agrisoli]